MSVAMIQASGAEELIDSLEESGRYRPKFGWYGVVQAAWTIAMLALCAVRLAHLVSGGSLWLLAQIIGLSLLWALVALTAWLVNLALVSPHGLRGPR